MVLVYKKFNLVPDFNIQVHCTTATFKCFTNMNSVTSLDACKYSCYKHNRLGGYGYTEVEPQSAKHNITNTAY